MHFRLMFYVMLLSNPAVLAGAAPLDSKFPDTAAQLKELSASLSAAEAKIGRVLKQNLRIELAEDGRLQQDLHRVILLGDDQDLAKWSSLNFSWKKNLEARPEINIRVLRPDGTVHLMDPSHITEVQVGDAGQKLDSTLGLLKVAPPVLSTGSILDIVVKERELNSQIKSGRYRQILLRNFWPIDALDFELTWHPSQKLRFKLPANMPLKTSESSSPLGWSVLALQGEKIAALPDPEAGTNADVCGGSCLEFTTATNWSSVAAEYQAIVKNQLQASKKVPALLKKLRLSGQTQQKLIATISYAVQKDIQFNGIAFGANSIVPLSPDETLDLGRVAGKDQATLALALLQAAGIEAKLALVHIGSNGQSNSDLPGLERFNHVILAIRQGHEWTWFDPTAEYFKAGVLPPGVAGATALLVDHNSKDLILLPHARPQDNRLVVSKIYQIPRLGPANLLRSESASGVFDAFYRRSISASSPKDLLRDFEGSIDAQARLASSQPVNIKDYAQTILLEGTFNGSGTVNIRPSGTQVFAFPFQIFSGLPDFLDPLNDRDVRAKIADIKRRAESRQNLVTLPFVFQREYIYRFHLPSELELTTKPKSQSFKLGPATLEVKSSGCGPACWEVHSSFNTGPSLSWTPLELRAYAKDLGVFLDDKNYTLDIKPKALALIEQSKWPEATLYARRAAEAKNASPADQLVFSKILLLLHLNNEAHAIIRKAAKNGERDKHILLYASELLIRGDDLHDCTKASACPEASQYFEQVLKLDPSDRFALRTLPLLLIYNNLGIRYGHGSDFERADGAFARAMKTSLMDEPDFVNTYLQHLAFTGQWIAMDQVLRRPPSNMPPHTLEAWKIINLLGNQRLDEAKQALEPILSSEDSDAQIQGLIKELTLDRRYLEGSQLFQILETRQPKNLSGAKEAFASIEPCPSVPLPDSKLETSLRHYICAMLDPSSSSETGEAFVPEFVRQDPALLAYFKQGEWSHRLDNSQNNPELPSFFIIDSASSSLEIAEKKDLQDGQLLTLRNKKTFTNSPFAAAKTAGPILLSSFSKGGYHFLSLDTPSSLSMLMLNARRRNQTKAVNEYAELLNEQLKQSLAELAEKQSAKPATEQYILLLRNFAPLLRGSNQQKDLGAAIFAPSTLDEQALAIMQGPSSSELVSVEQRPLFATLILSRLTRLKRFAEARQQLRLALDQGSIGYALAQESLDLAHSTKLPDAEVDYLLKKLEPIEFLDKKSLIAELKNLQGDHKAAEQTYKQWLIQADSSGLVENNLAWFYFTQGKISQETLQLAQKSVEKNNQSVASLNTLAAIQAELGMTEASLLTQNQYLKLLGDRSLGAADSLVVALNAAKLGLHSIALNQLRAIQLDSSTSDLRDFLRNKIQFLEKSSGSTTR